MWRDAPLVGRRKRAGDVRMTALLDIVHEDEGLLVVNKPAGLVCHPTKGDVYSSLISRVRLYCDRYASCSIHLINRLDRETSGLVLVAKMDAVAAAMRRRWEVGAVSKTYVAVVEGKVNGLEGEIDLPIGPDEKSAIAIKGCVRRDGAPSRTLYRRLRVLSSNGEIYSVLRVFPKSGRKHQIRIHLAHVGHPIVGDKIYGADEQFYLAFVESRLNAFQRARLRLENHALHAGGLEWTENENYRRFEVLPNLEMQRFMSQAEEIDGFAPVA